jgi:hypothetical protein
VVSFTLQAALPSEIDLPVPIEQGLLGPQSWPARCAWRRARYLGRFRTSTEFTRRPDRSLIITLLDLLLKEFVRWIHCKCHGFEARRFQMFYFLPCGGVACYEIVLF